MRRVHGKISPPYKRQDFPQGREFQGPLDFPVSARREPMLDRFPIFGEPEEGVLDFLAELVRDYMRRGNVDDSLLQVHAPAQ